MNLIYVKVQIQGYSRKELVTIDANSKKIVIKKRQS